MRLIGVYPSSRTACGGNMLRAVEDAIVELILDTWQPVQKVAADVRRLSHRFCFRGNLSLVTSAATGSGVFQRAASDQPGVTQWLLPSNLDATSATINRMAKAMPRRTKNRGCLSKKPLKKASNLSSGDEASGSPSSEERFM